MKPNIFDFATKELTQDAFIAWLLSWADPKNKEYDAQLHACSQDFIKELIQIHYKNAFISITRVDVGRQWENIDIWAEVCTNDENYLIIIEDKTFSSEHSNQLIAYKESGEKHCKENNFTLVPIYLKTGSEAERILQGIRDKGFATFNRKNFIDILVQHKDIHNNIFTDFLQRLQNLEAAHQAFEHTIIDQWNDACWVGFYEFLDKEIKLILWHYVNPPSGKGFWNACLNWKDWGGFPVYIQTEERKLCFKIATALDEIDFEGEFDRSEKRNEWHSILLSFAKEHGFNEIRKPDRFGTGNYMTCAVVDQANWLGNGQKIIDKTKVIEKLKLYKKFLVDCLINKNPG